jgi:hypothetical protein
MANAIYPLAKQRLLEWALGGDGPPEGGAELKVLGVTDDYSYDAEHEILDDVDSDTIVIPGATLQNVTIDGGLVDADDIIVSGATPDSTLNALIIYAEWGGGETLLMAYMDAPTDSSLPTVIDSATGLITFDPWGIFRI